MSDIEIIDGFLDEKSLENIFQLVNSSTFPYFLGVDKYTVPKKEYEENLNHYKNLKDYLQFVHTFYDLEANKVLKSKYFYIIQNFIQALLFKKNYEKFKLVRAKVNVQLKLENNTEYNHNTPHNDLSYMHKVFLFYINDSDGDTFFFNNKEIFKRVTPKKNRLVIFDGNIKHAGTHPIKSEKRIVLNIDGIIND